MPTISTLSIFLGGFNTHILEISTKTSRAEVFSFLVRNKVIIYIFPLLREINKLVKN